MKTIYLIIMLFLIFALFSPSIFAQDYTRLDLPEGAIMRLGKRNINGFCGVSRASVFHRMGTCSLVEVRMKLCDYGLLTLGTCKGFSLDIHIYPLFLPTFQPQVSVFRRMVAWSLVQARLNVFGCGMLQQDSL